MFEFSETLEDEGDYNAIRDLINLPNEFNICSSISIVNKHPAQGYKNPCTMLYENS